MWVSQKVRHSAYMHKESIMVDPKKGILVELLYFTSNFYHPQSISQSTQSALQTIVPLFETFSKLNYLDVHWTLQKFCVYFLHSVKVLSFHLPFQSGKQKKSLIR
uniref:Uncharacterized protein n=1 Tax=Clastoptera arizonana TaxID=38151 RepID=A0A1B6CT82_9HEMI